MAASSNAAAPNTVIRNMLNRSRDVDLDTTSSIVRTSATGSPVAWRSCSCTVEIIECGSTRVLTTHASGVILRFKALAASGTWACGMNIRGCGLAFKPLSRLSPTTPTICRAGSSANSRMMPRPMTSRSDNGSSFQYCLAIASLITTTGGAAPSSPSFNPRPRLIGILKTSKYPGDAVTQPPPPWNGLFSSGRPTMVKGSPYPPWSGTQHAALADSTPGRRRKRSTPSRTT